MICPKCTELPGFVRNPKPKSATEWQRAWVPCPECGGFGLTYCCSGDRECEDTEETRKGGREA